MVKVASGAIYELLRRRHAEDVFVGECKDGPTQGCSVGILDAWAMKKSWAHPRLIGYEIKVDRQDFLRDNKWQRYLKSCNELYFVCPTDLIKLEEIHAECGLIWLSKQGAMLITKKKAPYRKIEPPVDLFLYLLMNRVVIGADTSNRIAFWQDFIETRHEWNHIGHMVSKRINDLYKRDVLVVQKEVDEMRRALHGLEEVAAFCKKMNINPVGYDVTYQVQRKLEAGHEIFKTIQQLRRQLDDFEEDAKQKSGDGRLPQTGAEDLG